MSDFLFIYFFLILFKIFFFLNLLARHLEHRRAPQVARAPLFADACYRPFSNISSSPGGPLECQGGYQARPKIHVIRVVFQDQALYARTSFRGVKTCKSGKKGVFLVI